MVSDTDPANDTAGPANGPLGDNYAYSAPPGATLSYRGRPDTARLPGCV